MPLETFKSSDSLTMGVELEMQLVNTFDLDLSSSANDLLELLSRKPFPGVVTPEMTQSMIEIATSIQTEHGPLLAQLREGAERLCGERLWAGVDGRAAQQDPVVHGDGLEIAGAHAHQRQPGRRCGGRSARPG